MPTTETKYPTIRNVMDQLKAILDRDFLLIVSYSGSCDSGWFDSCWFREPAGNDIFADAVPDKAWEYLKAVESELYDELGKILERRFPGWEIGDGHVMGSSGHFTVDSRDRTILQHHQINFESSEDASPDEVERF